MGDLLERLLQELGLRVAEDRAEAPVDTEPSPVQADMGDAHPRLLEGGAEPRLALAQRRVCGLQLAHAQAGHELGHDGASQVGDRQLVLRGPAARL